MWDRAAQGGAAGLRTRGTAAAAGVGWPAGVWLATEGQTAVSEAAGCRVSLSPQSQITCPCLPLAPFSQKPKGRGVMWPMGVSLPKQRGRRMDLGTAAVRDPGPGVVAVGLWLQPSSPTGSHTLYAPAEQNPSPAVPQLARSAPLRWFSLGLESPSPAFCPCRGLLNLGPALPSPPGA